MMFRAAQFGADGKREIFLGSLCKIVAGNLSLTVGFGLRKNPSPRKLEILDSRFLFHLTEGRLKWIFPFLHDSFRKIPKIVSTEKEIKVLFLSFSNHHGPGREGAGLHLSSSLFLPL